MSEEGSIPSLTSSYIFTNENYPNVRFHHETPTVIPYQQQAVLSTGLPPFAAISNMGFQLDNNNEGAFLSQGPCLGVPATTVGPQASTSAMGLSEYYSNPPNSQGLIPQNPVINQGNNYMPYGAQAVESFQGYYPNPSVPNNGGTLTQSFGMAFGSGVQGNIWPSNCQSNNFQISNEPCQTSFVTNPEMFQTYQSTSADCSSWQSPFEEPLGSFFSGQQNIPQQYVQACPKKQDDSDSRSSSPNIPNLPLLNSIRFGFAGYINTTSAPPTSTSSKSSWSSPSGSKKSPSNSMDHLVPHTTCSNCGTQDTSIWRRGSSGEIVCNACSLYWKVHGIKRPISMKRDTVSTRKRKHVGQSSSAQSKRKAAKLKKDMKVCNSELNVQPNKDALNGVHGLSFRGGPLISPQYEGWGELGPASSLQSPMIAGPTTQTTPFLMGQQFDFAELNLRQS